MSKRFTRARNSLNEPLGERWVFWVALVSSLLLSAWKVFSDDVINSDGILYLRAASAFVADDPRGAFALYPWPFYSWLISLPIRAFGFSAENSAQLINAFFFALTVTVFIGLVKELGGRGAGLWAAAAVILAYPNLNDYRAFIVRDSGYWAFYLTALWWFIRFFRNPEWRYAVGWLLAMAVATLFRIEGSIFLVLAPLAFLWRPESSWHARFALLARAYSVHIALLVFAIPLYLLFAPEYLQASRLFDPLLWLRQLTSGVPSLWQTKAAALESTVLNPYSDHLAYAALIAVFFIILVVEVIKGVTLLYSALAAHAAYQRLFYFGRGFFIWFVVLNLTPLMIFLSSSFFLTGRFVMPLALLFILAAPFSLAALYASYRERKNPWFPLVCAVLVFMAVDGLTSFGPSKSYLKEAGLWLRENTTSEALVYSDEARLVYYADKKHSVWNRPFDWSETTRVITDGSWKNYDYLALALSRKRPEHEKWLLEKLDLQPTRTFKNNRGDQVLIFKVR